MKPQRTIKGWAEVYEDIREVASGRSPQCSLDMAFALVYFAGQNGLPMPVDETREAVKYLLSIPKLITILPPKKKRKSHA